MRKTISILLFFVLILSGCAKPEEKPSESTLPKEPKTLQTLQDNLLTIMAKIDLMPSINNALETRNKLMEISFQKEKELASISESRLPEKDKLKTPEDMEKDKVKLSSHIVDTCIYPSLLAEDVEDLNKLEKEPLKFKLEEYWLDINKDLVNIHKDWNSLQAGMSEISADDEYIKNFETNLNSLTDSIGQYNIFDSIVYCNNMTKYLSSFRQYFKTFTNNDIDIAKYSVRKAVLLSDMENYEEALKSVTSISELLTSKTEIYSKEKEKFAKLKYSIQSLEKSIENKNLKLVQINAPIVISNLNEFIQKETSEN
ncbi:hypothetical protein [Tepidibacter hydrothermalis]|uniref:Lipoprotein n=1 Tax=Tepidibacter hydrothermalis TaxID=3036126 RepID=A0ABY8ECF0_9FIRM|nr:hypothetical protein [Tepidibacter hydrothermalis]WFD10611.1 hypothetical protein P4S50_00635 [Tepidibacter hydrothermalis]